MITQQTAEAIWDAYREIEAGKTLLADMKAEREKSFSDHDKTSPTLRDAFGKRRHLELGIPSGSNAHRLFRVAPGLAESIIRAHIAEKESELVEANERARAELDIAEVDVSKGGA